MAKIYYATKDTYVQKRIQESAEERKMFGREKRIDAKKVKQLLNVIDQGLSHGLGAPVPGHMCIQAAVCHVMGENHGDSPTCVHPIIRSIGIRLNDSMWGAATPYDRAHALRRLAVAELGSVGLSNTALIEALRTNFQRELGIEAHSWDSLDEAIQHDLRMHHSSDLVKRIQKIADVTAMTLKELGSPGAQYLEMTCENSNENQ